MSYNASLHRLHKRVTRGQLEKRLGGNWQSPEDAKSLRRNGRWETWKAPSRLVQGRRDCYIKNLRSGAVKSGRNWQELAQALGVASGQS